MRVFNTCYSMKYISLGNYIYYYVVVFGMGLKEVLDKEVLDKALKDKGAGGVIDTDSECGCSIGDLAPHGPLKEARPGAILILLDDKELSYLSTIIRDIGAASERLKHRNSENWKLVAASIGELPLQDLGALREELVQLQVSREDARILADLEVSGGW